MGERKEGRVKMVLPVRVLGTDGDGKPYCVLAHTLDFSRLGARLGGIRQPLRVAETVTVEYKLRRARFVVRWVGQPGTRFEQQVGVQTLEPKDLLWLEVPEQQPYTDNVALALRRTTTDARAADILVADGNVVSDAADAGLSVTESQPETGALVEDLLSTVDRLSGEQPDRPGNRCEPAAERGPDRDSQERSSIAALEQQIILESLPLDAALDLVAANAVRLLNAAGAAIALPENSDMVCRASAGRAPSIGVRFRAETGLTGEAMKTGRVVVCSNTFCDPRVDAEVWRRVGMQSAVSAPISLPAGATAVLEVFAAESDAFTSAQGTLLEELSGLITRVVEPAAGNRSRCNPSAGGSTECK